MNECFGLRAATRMLSQISEKNCNVNQCDKLSSEHLFPDGRYKGYYRSTCMLLSTACVLSYGYHIASVGLRQPWSTEVLLRRKAVVN